MQYISYYSDKITLCFAQIYIIRLIVKCCDGQYYGAILNVKNDFSHIKIEMCFFKLCL